MTSYSGLSKAEALKRFNTFGPNELPSGGRQSIPQIFLRVLQEPLLLLLVACGFIYVLTGEGKDGYLLFGSAIFVISITLYQEVKSERALEALRDLSSPRALVFRDGSLHRIAGREVVPADLIRVSEGDRIPADAVVISTSHLAVDESLLTGESFSVTKIAAQTFLPETAIPSNPSCCIHSGTLVIGGQGLAIVTATGAKTGLGKIGSSLEAPTETTTPLQHEMRRMIRVFGLLGIVFSIAITVVYGLTRGNWPKGILAGLAAAMSLLPEEFPVVMTVFLAMGAWRISKAKVLTRRVAAIEALGSISALCVDKTGTLTQNRMAVRYLSNKAGVTERLLLEYGGLACNETPFDPMEKAILETSSRLKMETGAASFHRARLYPLSSGLMAMSCAWKLADRPQFVVAAKGAPEAVLQLCHSSKAESQQILTKVKELASRGLRVLAVARAEWTGEKLPDSQHDFEFEYLGLIALEDPIRGEVPAAINECKSAGIRVVMLTGDYPETAKAIAKQLGLSDSVVSGFDLSQVDDLKLRQIVQSSNVFARVTPEQKLRIITALKANGERVAMTGDGVNDAPSLKWADIGVAMGGRGTDVAREAAAIVLLDDSFASLVSAIRLGRRIYDNLKKAMLFILAIHVPIAGLAMLPVVFGLPLLLLPAHIVFLELIIDPACSLVYEAEREESDVMKRVPRKANAMLIRWKDLLLAGLQGSVILGLVFGLDIYLLRRGHTAETARTSAFLALFFSNLGLILVDRVRTGSLIEVLAIRNVAFIGVAIGGISLLAIILSFASLRAMFGFGVPSIQHLAMSFGIGLASLLLCDGARWIFAGFREP